jgi:hypothetical protein
LVAAVPVALFGYVQYSYYLHDRRFSHFFTPYRALGPLYFLANQSPEDDWVGYALLAVAVPCLLAVVIWPRRWTMLIAIAAALAWVFPGCIEDRHMSRRGPGGEERNQSARLADDLRVLGAR